MPSMRGPASKDISSNSMEQCETEVCFLHIQLSGTNVRLPKILNCVKLKPVFCATNLLAHMFDLRKCTEFLPMLTSSLQGLQQNRNPGTMPICNAVLYSHMTILPVIICVVNVRAKRLSQALVDFVPARGSLFPTTECLVYQCVSLYRHLGRFLWTILQPVPILLL